MGELPPLGPPSPFGAPFGGNLFPRGAIGGQIEFRPDGWQHVTIYTDGAHVSYNRQGSDIRGVHGNLHGFGTLEPRR